MAGEKSILMKLCTESVYYDNVFHLLGLQTTATPKQIRRRREDIESAHEMGGAAWEREFRYLLGNRTVPSFEEVQVAFEHLVDPEYRIVSEFFWMWPTGEDDIALKELTNGKRSVAIKIWEQAALGCGKKRSIAQHNLAVLYQFYAIDAELQAINLDEDPPEDFHNAMCEYWDRAFEYWEELADNDDFWEIFAARMREFNEPRLTGGFGRRLRQQFPVALDIIDARLAAEYARREKYTEAQRHVDYMLKTMSGRDDVDDAMRILFEPTFSRIELLIERYNQVVKDSPQKGLDAANEIIDATSDDYSVICGLLGGESPTSQLHAARRELRRLQHDPKEFASPEEIEMAFNKVKKLESLLKMRESLYDPIVRACFNYLFKYSEATKDWSVAIRWDEFLSRLALSAKLKKTIDEDLLSVFKAQANGLIEKFVTIVKADAGKGAWAIGQLMKESRQLLATIEAKYGEYCELGSEIRETVAVASRAFLVSYGNATKDWEGCLAFVAKIKEFTSDPETIKRLNADFKTLSDNAQQDVLRKNCWHCHRANGKMSEMVFVMYGDIDYLLPGQIRWNVTDRAVPLCRKCKMKYYSWCMLLCMSLGAIFSLFAIVIYDWQMASVACCLGIFAGIYCCRLIRNSWFNEYPDIKHLRERGYKYGRKPSGVQT